MVDDEEPVAIDARYSDVTWRTGGERIGLRVVPIAVGTQVIEIILNRDIVRGIPRRKKCGHTWVEPMWELAML